MILGFVVASSAGSLRAQAIDSLRYKLGQMIVVGFIGQTITDSLFVDLTQRNLGGVIVSYANGNLNNPAQIKQLTNALKATATTPPFIAVDQEGGLVARLGANNGFSTTNSNYTLGTVWASVESTQAQAARMAGWLVQCGMNLNLAPVIDVNVNPVSPAIGYYGRSFSNIPSVVSTHAAAFIDKMHERGLMTATKHFPGHGSAMTDSHFSLPDITNTWSDAELDPYRSLIASHRLDVVMVGHLYNAHIDSVYPTSLSSSTVNGLLRQTLGYDGVVITDAMGMGALADFDAFDRAELAVKAGADILLYTSSIYNGSSLMRQLVDSLSARVHRGSLAESRVNESYARVKALKARAIATSVEIPIAEAPVPTGYSVGNYPNPFNPSTTIRMSLPERSSVRVEIYDVLGRMVERLYEGEAQAGFKEFGWTANAGSGFYFCRVVATPMSGSGRGVALVQKMLRLQ